MKKPYLYKFIVFTSIYMACTHLEGQFLDKKKIFNSFSFWQNKDFEWYAGNIPFIETPAKDIDETYYYRFELMTAHMVYGSPHDGYSFTEFIDRPWWSGTYGAISCAVGLQLDDIRWLRNKRYAEDYAKYWLMVPGAQPRNYSTSLADAVWNVYKNYYDRKLPELLLTGLMSNYQKWEIEHFVPTEGLFAWDGMHDGMETNINSRQTKNTFSGAVGYRPTLNSYMYGDAKAIASMNALLGDTVSSVIFTARAERIKSNFQKKCWDSSRQFFFHRFMKDEANGVLANSLTYQTGKFAGQPFGREEIGFIPWCYNMVDSGYEKAWKYLMDPQYFYAPFGPLTVERNDPLFYIAKNCCAWSGNSWPYATSQTLKAMANLLRDYPKAPVSTADYFKLLDIFAISHRKDGKPYIAEACNPYTGLWDGHDKPGHSEHYFHSSYVNLVLSGLLGIIPLASDSIELNPLVPDDWDYFAVDGIAYHGHNLSVLWDKSGKKYNRGKGLSVWSDGKEIYHSQNPRERVIIPLQGPRKELFPEDTLVNVAVNNNEQSYYPRAFASSPGVGKEYSSKLNDGQYWYYERTPNRWHGVKVANKPLYAGVDFGSEEEVSKIKLYLINNDTSIRTPNSFVVEYWAHRKWVPVSVKQRIPLIPSGGMCNTVNFDRVKTRKIRVVFSANLSVGVSELEVWGDKKSYIQPPTEKLTDGQSSVDIDHLSASYTSKFDDPNNLLSIKYGSCNPSARWTSYQSPHAKDSISISFKKKVPIKQLRLFLYNDGHGVMPPKSCLIYYQDDAMRWRQVSIISQLPMIWGPDLNVVNIKPIYTSALEVIFFNTPPKSFCGIYGMSFL